MLRVCSRAWVGVVKPPLLVESMTLAAGRNLILQNELPRLPVPPLRQTCELYLRILEPVVDPDELKRAKDLVEEFQRAGGVGEGLQRDLEQRAASTDNWLTEGYLKAVFLDLRSPLIFSSPALMFPPAAYQETDMAQVRGAAKAIAAKLDVKTMNENGTLPVDYLGGKQLCMKQCEQLMSSCRVPGPKSDSLVFYSRSITPPKHITVVHNHQFFKLDVYNSDGTRLTVEQLCVQLDKICNASQPSHNEPVGILTTQDRDTWSQVYSSLIKDETNKESVWTIESSIFTVCLDGAMPPVCHHKHHQMLHGGGSRWNSGNRWFDKSLQLIVAEDGTCGGCFSHAAADGTAIVSLCDHSLELMRKPEAVRSSSELLPMPQKLNFNITPEIKKDIEEAKEHMDRMVQNLELAVSVFSHFGKNLVKAYKMSPDGFVQVAMQLAYYRIHQQCCPTLEAVSLRTFKQGRIATISSNTGASDAFVKAFDDPKTRNSARFCFMKRAIEEHRANTTMASRGQSVRTHLLMLKRQAAEKNISMPGVFMDSSFTKVFDFKLVTSQLISKAGCSQFMAPEEPDTYSMCYSIFNHHIHVSVFYFHTVKTHRENKAAGLLQALEDAMLDMKTILEQTSRTQMESGLRLEAVV